MSGISVYIVPKHRRLCDLARAASVLLGDGHGGEDNGVTSVRLDGITSVQFEKRMGTMDVGAIDNKSHPNSINIPAPLSKESSDSHGSSVTIPPPCSKESSNSQQDCAQQPSSGKRDIKSTTMADCHRLDNCLLIKFNGVDLPRKMEGILDSVLENRGEYAQGQSDVFYSWLQRVCLLSQ